MYKEVYIPYATLLKKRLVLCRQTAKKLYEESGVTNVTISRIIKGKSLPRRETMDKLDAALDRWERELGL